MGFVSAVIPAAGIGSRMNPSRKGIARPKQYLMLEGKPVLAWTLDFFQNLKEVDEIILVVSESHIENTKNEIVIPFGFDKVKKIIPGGAERQDSVLQGLIHCADEADVILVHDAARPFPPTESVQEAIISAFAGIGGVLGIPTPDTIKQIDEHMNVVKTLDRDQLIAVQTPQVFPAAMLKMAFEMATRDQFQGTDEAMIMENADFPVRIFPGSRSNIKITIPEDLTFAEAFAKSIGRK